MDITQEDYLLGSSDAEILRLQYQHQLWKPEAEALWQRAGFKEGQTLLDAGSGPGFAAFDLLQKVGTKGELRAFDASAKFVGHVQKVIEEKQIPNMTVVHGNVEDIEMNKEFDGIYLRWVLCFLARPDKAIEKLSQHLKKGGRIAICDYLTLDYALYPHSPAFDRLLEAIRQSWRLSGGTLTIQMQVTKLLESNGLRVIDYLPISRIGRPGDDYWNWPESFFKLYVPQLVQKALLTQAESDLFWEEWNERKKLPYAILKTPTFLDVVAEKI